MMNKLGWIMLLAVGGNFNPSHQHRKEEKREWAPPLNQKDFDAGRQLIQSIKSGAGSDYSGSEKPRLADIEVPHLEEEERTERNGQRIISAKSKSRWPNAVVPYRIETSYDDHGRAVIASAFAEVERKTCIKFRPKTRTDESWFDIVTHNGGCQASIGYRGPGRDHHLRLGAACIAPSTALHELLHIVGMHHEHNRPDRDNYIKINWDRVQEGMKDQYYKSTFFKDGAQKKCSKDMSNDELDSCTSGIVVTSYNTPYDFDSVMHYDLIGFAIDRSKPAISLVDPSSAPDPRTIGSSDVVEMSKNNALQLNIAYSCPNKTMSEEEPKLGGRITDENGEEDVINEVIDAVLVEEAKNENGSKSMVGSRTGGKETAENRAHDGRQMFIVEGMGKSWLVNSSY